MEFLNVKKEAWPAEFHASDIHEYAFFEKAGGAYFLMNHTIPATNFHVRGERRSRRSAKPFRAVRKHG